MSEYMLDGVDLDDVEGRWRLTGVTELPTWGAPRNVNVQIPGRTGVVPLAPVSFDPFTVVLGLVVFDSGAGRVGLDANMRALGRVLRSRGRLLTMTHNPGAGAPTRVAQVRVSGSVAPDFFPMGNAASVKATVECPEGVWRDPANVEMDAANLAKIDGGVMPVPDPLILVTPTKTPIKVVDVVSGASLTFTGAIQDGKTLLINPATYTATWTNNGWSGGTDVSSALSISAGGFYLTPDSAGHHSLTVSGGTAQVRARRAY